MLSKKSRHMRSLVNLGSRRPIVPALRRRFGMTLVMSCSNPDEVMMFSGGPQLRATYAKRSVACDHYNVQPWGMAYPYPPLTSFENL